MLARGRPRVAPTIWPQKTQNGGSSGGQPLGNGGRGEPRSPARRSPSHTIAELCKPRNDAAILFCCSDPTPCGRLFKFRIPPCSSVSPSSGPPPPGERFSGKHAGRFLRKVFQIPNSALRFRQSFELPTSSGGEIFGPTRRSVPSEGFSNSEFRIPHSKSLPRRAGFSVREITCRSSGSPADPTRPACT